MMKIADYDVSVLYQNSQIW